MRHLITTLLAVLLLAGVAAGQGKRSVPLGTIRTTDTNWMQAPLRLDSLMYMMSFAYRDSSKCLSVMPNGRVFMRNCGTGGGSTDTTSLSARIEAALDTASDAKQIALAFSDYAAELDSQKQNRIVVTAIGTSGAATLSNDTLNIPQYSGGGGSSYTFSTPLSETAGAVSIANAAADGSTKGAATFTPADFNSTTGNISIDYTNGQAATGSVKGFLTATDWTTFNGKQAALTSGTNIKTINSTSLLGSGNISITTDTTGFGLASRYWVGQNYVSLAGSYTNPSWIVSIPWSKITGTPTIDAIPTNGSTNAVSSDGVFDAEALKAPLASPALTGTPTAPTASGGTNTTQIATTAFVTAAINAVPTPSLQSVLNTGNTAVKSLFSSMDGSGNYQITYDSANDYAIIGGGARTQLGLFGVVGTTALGDVNGAGNSTVISIDDIGKGITVNTGAEVSILKAGGTGGKLIVESLKTSLTAPTAVGTSKMVTTDQNGLLSFQNIPSGGGGSGTVTSIATTSPITGGTITTTGTIGINDAAADGSTKGASTYTAADFNATSGLISLDYTNGQAADGTHKGFLTSSDWTTFNGKLGSEVDGSVSNEGSLSVTAGTGSTSVIHSNTSGSTDVTITAAGINTISENTGTGVITVTGTEVDGSVTNEGLLTVSGGATPVLSSNTSGNTDVSFTGTGGITVSQDVGGPNILNFNIGSSAIAISKLAITGTPTGSKYLRDDGSWQLVAGGGGATIASTTSILKGDGAGNGVAATLGTDYQQTPDIQTYSTAGSFTWTKPANARRVFVTVIGGGGGGGSGSKAATGVSATGGAGGAGGGISQLTFDASDLTSTVSVTVGAGGAGGASQTTNSSTGNTGVSGGISSFGNYLRAVNGTGGATGATAGVAGTGLVSSGGNGGTGGVTSSGIQSGAHNMGAAGGGGGGAISAANTAASGAAGNVAATFGAAANPTTNAGSSGASGTTGASPVGYSYYGGGGGASSTSTNGGAGAAPGSGNYGAGGGGGGAARDSVGNSGAGGNGADGAVIVVTYF